MALKCELDVKAGSLAINTLFPSMSIMEFNLGN